MTEKIIAALSDGTFSAELFGKEIAHLEGESQESAIAQVLDLLSKKDTLLELTSSLSHTLDLSALIKEAVFKISKMLDADRASLFLIDWEKKEFLSKVAEGVETQEIRFPLTSGIAGEVVSQGKSINLEDAYDSPIFNREIDKETGYRTRSLLCAPVTNRNNQIIGVVQVINKKEGAFTDGDEEILADLSVILALSLENSLLYEKVSEQQRQVESLLRVANALSSELDLDSLIQTIMNKASEIVDADRATLFLIDSETKELWSKVAHGAKEIRFDMSQGIAGKVAVSGKTLNIPDAYEHPLFNKAIDVKTGYRTKTILCVPIRNTEGKVTGVTQVINKRSGVFSVIDEQMLTAFSAQAAIALENAQLYERTLNLKNFLDSVLQNLSNGVVTLDTEERITMANQAALKILQLPEKEWEKAKAVDFFGEHASELLEKFRKVLSENTKIEEFDADYHTTRGESMSINLVVEPLCDQLSGQKLGTVGIFEDMTKEKRQKSMISRFLSKDIAERFLEEDWSTLMKGINTEVTILFCDIRNFTSITESNSAEEVVDMLNEYFTHMVDAIFSCAGTLDKYIGDAIMAIFGAPIKDPDNARNAVLASLKMKKALRTFNASREKRGLFSLRFGVGLSTGNVLCGTIGSEKKMEYTGIGDRVNLASRLEGANKVYGTEIIISEHTEAKIGDEFRLRELDKIKVKGKDIPVRIFEVLGEKDEVLADDVEELVGHFTSAIESIKLRDFGTAAEHFQTALRVRPEDKASKIWLDRSEQFMVLPPPESWDGSFEFTEK